MPVGLLAIGGNYTISIGPSVDFDLFSFIGSPSAAVAITVYIPDGVVISSSNASIPALDMSGFNASSSILLVNKGEVRGAGGDGADAGKVDSAGWFYPGGGGGAGTVFGVGGTAFSPGIPGVDGDAANGGAGGGTRVTSIPDGDAGNGIGSDGGTAINIGCPTTITNSLIAVGKIFGGGGGGGVNILDPGTSGDGGDLGEVGVSPALGTAGGDAGYAVKENGFTVTWTEGYNPTQVKGTVG